MVTECIYGKKKKGEEGYEWRAAHQVVSLGWSSLDLLCQKKTARKRRRKNINWPVKNKRGKEGKLYLPLKQPSPFLLNSSDCSPVFYFTYILNLSPSFPFLFSRSPHLSRSDMFSRAQHPSIPYPPTVARWCLVESPWGKWKAGGGPPGNACWVQGDTGALEGRS